jgi:hypothetical protein
MAAGFRSPAALWIGGAGSPPPSAGVRSLLAFWMGGAATTPSTAVIDTHDGLRRKKKKRTFDDLEHRQKIRRAIEAAAEQIAEDARKAQAVEEQKLIHLAHERMVRARARQMEEELKQDEDDLEMILRVILDNDD